MRLEQIQAFLAIAETGSFQQAARRCGVTQSTISRQIQSLETAVGLPLFHRGSKATLTLGGEQFVTRARRICQEWQLAIDALDTLRRGEQPELCVAAVSSLCAHFLPPILEQFGQDYPKTQLRVTALGSDRALKVLRDGLVDIAIVMNNPYLSSNAEVIVEYLYDEPIQILMAASHPLAQHGQVPWSQLAQYPQLVFKDGYGMQRLVQEQFQKQGLQLRAAVELNTLDAFRGMVRQGQSIALLPHMALADADGDPTLAVRSLAPPQLSRQVVLVTTHDRLLIPPIKHFCELTRRFLGPARSELRPVSPPSPQSPPAP